MADGSPGSDDGDDTSAIDVATEGESWRIRLEDLEEPEGLTPGSPDAEHVAFVLLGAVTTVAFLAQFLL